VQGLQHYLSAQGMAALWSDAALLRAMLRFERALAEALADAGVAPLHAAAVIAQACDDLRPDAQVIGRAARRAGTLAIPLIDALKQAVQARDASALPWVHHGATSQDVIDTAMMLQAQAGLRWLDASLQAAGDALAALAQAHRDTAMTGRTLLQAAVPIPFGHKAAVWLDGIAQARLGLQRVQRDESPLQFGGAAGTLHALGEAALPVAGALAARLGLRAPPIPWHVQRAAPLRISAELSTLCAVLGKFGRDVALLAQDELQELREPQAPGRGASSAMPHKRNPQGSMLMVEAAMRAPGLHGIVLNEAVMEHERALGAWQNNLFVLRELFLCAGSAADAAVEVARGLQVDAGRMQANLARNAQQRFDAQVSFDAARQMIDAVCAQWRGIAQLRE
jgi:3-carboxy-cis,cis-muconate cycloisomerase